MDANPPIEEQIRQLKAAGWEPVRTVHHQPAPTFEVCEHSTTWRSPRGYLYRGPHGAWKVMRTNSHA